MRDTILRRRARRIAAAALLLATCASWAATPAELQRGYAAEAARASPGFRGFSAERGRRFFTITHGNDWRCASCHTDTPMSEGRHAVTGRALRPLAPAANPARFTDPAKVEKWFRRNCRDVVGRECTAVEKGDVLAWLSSLRAGGAR